MIVNGSDNALLTKFLDGALGCTPFSAPSVTTAGGTADSQALDELSAAVNSPTAAAALVPPNDEMVLVNGQPSIAKTNVYRALVDQPPLPANSNVAQVEATFCQNMVNIQSARSSLDMKSETASPSPVAAVGNNLATFMGNRLSMSFTNLNCQNFGLTNPVTVTLDGNGVATAVTYNTTQQVANVNGVANANGTATACATTVTPVTPTTNPATPTTNPATPTTTTCPTSATTAAGTTATGTTATGTTATGTTADRHHG